MLGGFAAITKEYLQLSTRVANTNPTVNSAINICRIDNVNTDRLTVDVFIPDTNVYQTNVPISFSTKGYGYGAYFMPKKGQLALMITTSYNKNFVLATSSVTSNKMDQTVLEGENMLLSPGGAYLKQDYLGNHITSSSSNNMQLNGSNMSNAEFSTGKEEKTLSSNIVRGLALDINKINNGIIKEDNIKLINYEQYFSHVATIKTYSPDEILVGGDIQTSIKSDILNNANNVIIKISDFIDKATAFNNDMLSTDTDKQTVKSIKDNFDNDLKTNFKLGKNTSLIIQKGNVVSRKINNIADIYELTDADFEKSPDNNDITLKISVIDENTQQEKSYIMMDSEGNGYMKFHKLNIITDTNTYVY